MPLEDLTGSNKYLNNLVETNPVGSADFLSDGDNHLRGIKTVLKNTFPNINGAVTVTPAQINKLAGLSEDIDDLLSSTDLATAFAALKEMLFEEVIAENDILQLGATAIKGLTYAQLVALLPVPYGIPFNAGWGYNFAGENLAVQPYGHLVLDRNIKLTGQYAYLGTASVGSALILDVKVNGSTLFTTRPQFAAGSTTLTDGTFAVTDLSAGNYLEFSMYQVGSTTPGQKLDYTLKAETR